MSADAVHNRRRDGVQWHNPAKRAEWSNHTIAGERRQDMGKGQEKKEKSNKPKLSMKEKKANKAAKKASKAAQ